jgi:hypothetical protein
MRNVYFLVCFTLIANVGFSQTTFKFIGNGYWTDSVNWLNNSIPPDTLNTYDTIYISPVLGDSCLLNKSQTVLSGAGLIISTGANFIILSDLNITSPKLKRILNPIDTIFLLCNPACPPIVTQNIETYVYDNLGRLVKRFLTTVRLSDIPTRIDTMSIFSYHYSGNNQLILGYTEDRNSSIPVNHIISYDNLNRIISDSIFNPQQYNNKVTIFNYLTDSIIQTERQLFPVGLQIKIDTMLLLGNNIFKERIKSFSTIREISHSFSSYRNPLSYVNNFSLLASDYKNGTNSSLYMIQTPQFITYNQATETLVVNTNNGAVTSQYISIYAINVDSFDRVQSFTNSSNGNKVTSFEYY